LTYTTRSHKTPTLNREEGWGHVESVAGTYLGVIDLTEGTAEPDPLHGCEEDCGHGLQLSDEFSDSGESVFSNLSSLPLFTPRSPSSSGLDSGSSTSGSEDTLTDGEE